MPDSFSNPFFIIGNPRSGTSLLRLMLNAHPRITVPPECGFALWFAEKYTHCLPFSSVTYSLYVKDVIKSKKFETWGISEEELLEYINERNPQNYVEMVDSVYRTYARKMGKTTLLTGDKNNYYIKHLSEIHKYFQDSKIIVIVRDGRDVASSYKKLNDSKIESIYSPKLSSDIKNIALEWRKNVQEIFSLRLPHILVRYEDIIKDTQFELQKICSFLGTDFHEEMLSYYLQNDEPIEFLQWKRKTMESPDIRNIGKYKKELTPQEVKIFEEYAGDMLKKLEYLD